MSAVGAAPVAEGRKRDAQLIAALGVAVAIGLAALVSLVWTPYAAGPAGLGPQLADPGASHWLGTDGSGRDVLSALMSATLTTLLASLFATLVGLLVGVTAGVALSSLGQRGGDATEVSLAGIAAPALLIAAVLAGLGSPGLVTIILAVAAPGAVLVALSTRAMAGRLQALDFVAAARIAGLTPMAAAQRHVMPQLLPRLAALGLRLLAAAVLIEMGVSYGGLGLAAPAQSLGQMLHDAQGLLQVKPLLAVAPGLVGLAFAMALEIAAGRLAGGADGPA